MKFKITGIYKITNKINNMSYIGQSENIWARWGAEESASRCQSDPFYYSLLSQALREFGTDNFECEILEECPAEQLNEREQYYIKSFDTLYPNGYNANRGGGVYKKLSCTMYDLDGNKIRDFNNNKEIIDFLFSINAVKMSYRYEIIKNIREACEGERQVVWGFRWSYQGQKIKLSKNSSKKIVYELDSNHNIIHTWYSCGEAARAIGADTSSLAACCRGENKTCKGRYFCYEENYSL